MNDSRTPPAASDEADILAFTPVPTSKRYDGWTPRRQRDFIDALAVMGVVRRAARAVGMSRQSAYNLRERPGAESFAAAWDNALSLSYDRTFAMAMDRAINGITIPRYYKGRQVGTITRPDLRLAMAVLAERPAAPSKAPPPTKPTKLTG
ncbi:hypothetical protein OK349_02685 [Sphingomonas sp. BT-65]|uniref:hypothetical protein n=1 Tax=Sphingomonas sp. BT-65 TaxID=2989821 RepID=UPI00223592DC|nr:hypothetical protein [Sphingomonas sp. BT-65]MCW4460598.1 hypothetical protein [Sphingomonas sp. BT-65]